MKQLFIILSAMFLTVFTVQVLIPYQEEEKLAEGPEQAILDIQQDFREFSKEQAVQYYFDNKELIDAYYAQHPVDF